MRNLNNELSRLEQKLRMAKIPDEVIEESMFEIKMRVSEAAEDAAVSAYYEAKTVGEMRNLDKFLDDLDIDTNINGFEINTMSGQTDFSKPPFPMLPKLLKNAKIAKDGSRYKVIPIKKKGTIALTKQQTSDALGRGGAANTINTARRNIRNNKQRRTFDPSNRPTTFDEIKNRARGQRSSNREKVKSSAPGTDFRVASSKQDANTAWVNPGKDGNMRSVLNQINSDLNRVIDDIITSIITEYERFI